MSAHERSHTITLLPSGITRSFPSGAPLVDALLDMGITLKTPCGGKGTCGKCRVRIEGTPPEVLACQTSITRNFTVHAQQKDIDQDICIPDIRPDSKISAAVDIGTTSVRISLVDSSHSVAFEIASFLNPQQRFGYDVISRIAAASDPAILLALQNLIRKAINIHLGSILDAAKLSAERVEQIVFSGNTTMLYLLFGIDVQPLGRYPYTTLTKDFMSLSAGEIGFDCIGSARAIALPVLSAFIGADLVGGLALCHERGITRNAFFIDLGTNGELFCLDGTGRPYATSCAMGPALEGMNISWGMTADTGAITRIHAEPEGYSYSMIGQGDPVGITGTALVDLIAILLDKGIIAPSGAFTSVGNIPPLPALSTLAGGEGTGEGVIVKATGHGSESNLLQLVYNGESRELQLWGDIRLTQKDIRNVQLAKGASLSASRFLLEAAGCSPDNIEYVIIAGAFGEHLDLEHFLRLGFIPDFSHARKEFFGNTSLKAAELVCMEPDFLKRASTLRDMTREVVLSTVPGFQDVFIQSLDFPRERTGYSR